VYFSGPLILADCQWNYQIQEISAWRQLRLAPYLRPNWSWLLPAVAPGSSSPRRACTAGT